MKLENIIKKIDSKIKPFSVKDVGMMGAIAVISIALGYNCYHMPSEKTKSKQTTESSEKYDKTTPKKEKKSDSKETPSRKHTKKRHKSKKHRHAIPSRRNYQPDYGEQNCTLTVNTYECIDENDPDSCTLVNTKTYRGSRDHIETIKLQYEEEKKQDPKIKYDMKTSQESKRKQEKKQATGADKSHQGRKDGYNLEVKFFEEGIGVAKPRKLSVETDNDDYGKTYLKKFSDNQALFITLDDYIKGEHFIPENITVTYEPSDMGDGYFNPYQIKRTKFKSKKGSKELPTQIWLTRKVLSGDIYEGTIKIEASLKNKYGETETETLEIIICDKGCQK